jgi:hypothetical protein
MSLQFPVNFPIILGEGRNAVAQISHAIFDQSRHLLKKKNYSFRLASISYFFPLLYSFDFARGKGRGNGGTNVLPLLSSHHYQPFTHHFGFNIESLRKKEDLNVYIKF